MVVDVSVSTYLGRIERYLIIVWGYWTVHGYPEQKSQDWMGNIIIPYTSSFGTSQNLPLWVEILLVKIYCLYITSYWPKELTGRSTSFILTLIQPPKFPFSPILSTISLNCGRIFTWYSIKSTTSLELLLGMLVVNRIIVFKSKIDYLISYCLLT